MKANRKLAVKIKNESNLMVWFNLHLEGMNVDQLPGYEFIIIDESDKEEAFSYFEKKGYEYEILNEEDQKLPFNEIDWNLRVHSNPASGNLALELKNKNASEVISADFGKHGVIVTKYDWGYLQSPYNAELNKTFLNTSEFPGLDISIIRSEIAVPCFSIEDDIITMVDNECNYPLYEFDPTKLFFYDSVGTYKHFISNDPAKNKKSAR